MGVVLSKEDLEKIDRGSLEILEETGVRIDHEAVLRRLADSGCDVDFEKNIAKIPGDLVKRCLATAPSAIKFSGRDWKSVEVGLNGGSFYVSGNALHIVEGRERHEFTKEKFVELVKVYDALPNVDGVVGLSLADVPPMVRDVVGFRLMAEYSIKHIRPCIFCARNTKAIKEMAEVLLEGRDYKEYPIYSLGYSICTPLHWTKAAMEVFLNSAGDSVPVTLNSECMLGGSSPVTMAGGIALGNAEILSGVVINQLFEEGRPVIHNLGFSHVLDMRTSVALTGAPEVALIGAAGADLAKFYNLPSAAWMSTDSLSADSQAGFEHMMLATAFASAGVNVIWGMGQVEAQLSLSKEQAVIDNEIIGYVKKYTGGIRVEADTLALDLIKKVGIAGEFLSMEHTLLNFKKELSVSETAWRNRREAVEQLKDFTIEDRAASRVKEIIAVEKTYITSEQKQELESIEKAWFKKHGY